jgi:hypothetical protein
LQPTDGLLHHLFWQLRLSPRRAEELSLPPGAGVMVAGVVSWGVVLGSEGGARGVGPASFYRC